MLTDKFLNVTYDQFIFYPTEYQSSKLHADIL